MCVEFYLTSYLSSEPILSSPAPSTVFSSSPSSLFTPFLSCSLSTDRQGDIDWEEMGQPDNETQKKEREKKGIEVLGEWR